MKEEGRRDRKESGVGGGRRWEGEWGKRGGKKVKERVREEGEHIK